LPSFQSSNAKFCHLQKTAPFFLKLTSIIPVPPVLGVSSSAVNVSLRPPHIPDPPPSLGVSICFHTRSSCFIYSVCRYNQPLRYLPAQPAMLICSPFKPPQGTKLCTFSHRFLPVLRQGDFRPSLPVQNIDAPPRMRWNGHDVAFSCDWSMNRTPRFFPDIL